LAWFRITPREEGDFQLQVYGYSSEEDNVQEQVKQVTNSIEARISVTSP